MVASLALPEPEKQLQSFSQKLGKIVALSFLSAVGVSAHAETKLKVFVGAQQRPEVMRDIFSRYMAQHPGVLVEQETGGATSELQSRYLNMMLSASDTHLDIFLIDIVRPAQYAAAGWLEPLDQYLGAERNAVIDAYLPSYRQSNVINGKLVVLPAFADAQFLYYRKDLLNKYQIEPPKTWDELELAASKILTAEHNPKLQGLSFQAKAVESAVCTFLMPYWSLGGSLDKGGKMVLDKPKVEAGLGMWLNLLHKGVVKKNIAEVATDDTRKEFQAGNVLFAVNFGYAWNHFQTAADSKVKDLVGVVPVPAMKNGVSASCMGGWQWGVSAFSNNKVEAVKLIRWLSSPEVSKILALKASNLPVFAKVYQDPEVLIANPFFGAALPAVLGARPRPVTSEYRAVSDALRINTSAVMAGAKTVPAAIADIEARFLRVNN
jgi:multiple sugar transport system substrate-binding protein